MPLIRLNKIERRRVAVFFTCLGIAVFAWLFFALSNQYTYEVRSVLNYSNTPIKKAFRPLQGDTVSLQVRGTGWNLLFSKLRFTPEAVDVDVSGLNQNHFIILDKQLDALNRQFHSDQQIVSVDPDTLYFDFSSRIIRKVPVNLISEIMFEDQYRIAGPVKIEPAFVTVSGPAEELQDLERWDTDSLKSTGVRRDIVAKVQLQANEKTNVSVYPKEVTVRIPVSEFTEKSIEVPIRVLNEGNIESVRLIPDKVRVTILTGLSKYPGVTDTSFAATVDLNDWKRGYQQLPVTLKKSPVFTEIVRIEPQMLDFIVKK
ncbi:MAG TPA: CdaR family protein [Sphingobacteriaceae bacterium]